MNRNCDFLMTCSVDAFKNWLNKYNINEYRDIIENDNQILFMEFSISIYDQENTTVKIFTGSFEKILKDLRDIITSLPREIQIFQDNDIDILQFVSMNDLDFLTENMYNFIEALPISMSLFSDFLDMNEQPQGTA